MRDSTDFSSSFFDVALVHTPVVYLDDPDDPDADTSRSSSFFEAETDGFGPVVEGEEELVAALESIVGRDFEMDEEHRARVERFFEGTSSGSSAQSVVAAIQAM